VGQYTDPLVVVVVAGRVSVVVAMAVAGMKVIMARAERRISLFIVPSLSIVVVCARGRLANEVPVKPVLALEGPQIASGHPQLASIRVAAARAPRTAGLPFATVAMASPSWRQQAFFLPAVELRTLC
jgi:hypothetical protein